MSDLKERLRESICEAHSAGGFCHDCILHSAALARIEELEARQILLNAECDGLGSMLLSVQTDCIAERKRAEAAEANLATAMEALKRIAYHVPSFDYAGRDEYGHIRTDFPGSPYDRGKADACKRLSGIAETAIRALKSTNQT